MEGQPGYRLLRHFEPEKNKTTTEQTCSEQTDEMNPIKFKRVYVCGRRFTIETQSSFQFLILNYTNFIAFLKEFEREYIEDCLPKIFFFVFELELFGNILRIGVVRWKDALSPGSCSPPNNPWNRKFPNNWEKIGTPKLYILTKIFKNLKIHEIRLWKLQFTWSERTIFTFRDRVVFQLVALTRWLYEWELLRVVCRGPGRSCGWAPWLHQLTPTNTWSPPHSPTAAGRDLSSCDPCASLKIVHIQFDS